MIKKRRIPWNKGLTKETDKRVKFVAEKLTGRKRSDLSRRNKINIRDKHPLWKFDWNNLGSNEKHLRMRYVIFKTDYCWICKKKTKKLQLSNKDHKYRNCLEDWHWVCQSCHMKWDYKYNNRAKKGKKL